MEYHFTIAGRLPSLNEYTRANRTNVYVGAKMKKEAQAVIAWALLPIKKYKITKPVRIEFTWYEENHKRDLDNVAFAKKFILDTLVEQGILENDSPKFVVGFTDNFKVDKIDPRIEVTIKEVEND